MLGAFNSSRCCWTVAQYRSSVRSTASVPHQASRSAPATSEIPSRRRTGAVWQTSPARNPRTPPWYRDRDVARPLPSRPTDAPARRPRPSVGGPPMVAPAYSATILGAQGHPVTVEVHVARGLPAYSVVGLPDEACRESRDRVRAAVLSSGLTWPAKRITVNLAPATQRKGGSGLDLAIAVGVLVADEQLPAQSVAGFGFVGELGLDGSVRPVVGAVKMVAATEGQPIVVPAASYREARAATERPVRTVTTLAELVDAARGEAPWPEPPNEIAVDDPPPALDLADVRGQDAARRALEV